MVLKYRQCGNYYSTVYYTIDIDHINQLMKDNYDMSNIGDVTEEDIENCMNDVFDERGTIIVDSTDNINYYSALYDIIYDYKQWYNEELEEQEVSYEVFDSII